MKSFMKMGLAFGAATAALVATPVSASPIAGSFSGNIVNGGSGSISGTFQYDSVYQNTYGWLTGTVTIGAYTYAFGEELRYDDFSSSVSLGNGMFKLDSHTTVSVDDDQNYDFGFTILNSSFSGPAVLPTSLTWDGVSTGIADGYLSDCGMGQGGYCAVPSVSFEVTHLSIAPEQVSGNSVPEPGTLALIGAPAFFFGLRRRRR